MPDAPPLAPDSLSLSRRRSLLGLSHLAGPLRARPPQVPESPLAAESLRPWVSQALRCLRGLSAWRPEGPRGSAATPEPRRTIKRYGHERQLKIGRIFLWSCAGQRRRLSLSGVSGVRGVSGVSGVSGARAGAWSPPPGDPRGPAGRPGPSESPEPRRRERRERRERRPQGGDPRGLRPRLLMKGHRQTRRRAVESKRLYPCAVLAGKDAIEAYPHAVLARGGLIAGSVATLSLSSPFLCSPAPFSSSPDLLCLTSSAWLSQVLLPPRRAPPMNPSAAGGRSRSLSRRRASPDAPRTDSRVEK